MLGLVSADKNLNIFQLITPAFLVLNNYCGRELPFLLPSSTERCNIRGIAATYLGVLSKRRPFAVSCRIELLTVLFPLRPGAVLLV